jgi:hypothetical protein
MDFQSTGKKGFHRDRNRNRYRNRINGEIGQLDFGPDFDLDDANCFIQVFKG